MGAVSITVLGSGTSVGVPTIGCDCKVCTSSDERDKRLRPSIIIRYDGRAVLIDTTPDFRTQALRFHIERLDAILFTHSHADHIMGLDDVRPYNFRQRTIIPIYGAPDTLEDIQRAFRYIFEANPASLTAIPKLAVNKLNGKSFDLFGLTITPIPLMHGSNMILGFRFGNAAYLTDHSEIPESSIGLLQGLDVLFLDSLRHKPHPTHSTVERSLKYVERLTPQRAFFTHICHDLGHEQTERLLPPHVRLAYDGLDIAVRDAL
jgi:phosphoribosyl 1,2-cyclic phosphate phosphodiesterase